MGRATETHNCPKTNPSCPCQRPFSPGRPLCSLEPHGEFSKVNFFSISSPKHFQIPALLDIADNVFLLDRL